MNNYLDDYYGDYDDEDFEENRSGWFSRLPAPIRAATLVAVIVLILDVATSVTAGAGATIALPLKALVYFLGGVLGALFGVRDHDRRAPVLNGAWTGVVIWLFSSLFNLLLSLVLTPPTLGISLIVQSVYLCCAPVAILLSVLLGAFGGLVYGFFHHGDDDEMFDEF